MRQRYRWVIPLFLAVMVFSGLIHVARADGDGVVRVVFFTSAECPHCQTVHEQVLQRLQEAHAARLQFKVIDIADPDEAGGLDMANYEMLIQAGSMFDLPPEEQGQIPLVIVGGQALVGEDDIRDQLPCLVDNCLVQGTDWPDIPDLNGIAVGLKKGGSVPEIEMGGDDAEVCATDEGTTCEVPTPTAAPIWIAYFYEVGCQECSRAEYVVRYVENKYEHVIIEEYNVQDPEGGALAEWLGQRAGVPESQRLATPALFIGDEYLIGSQISHQAVVDLMQRYADQGAERVWSDADPEAATQRIVKRFKSFGALTVAFAGLVDGLNPCAFATLTFFVSYLALSGRQGKEVLLVGAAFTLGVFLAYLAVGLGFFKMLDLLGDLLTTLGRWIYGVTGVFCLVLAVLSFVDFWKARRGEIGDMTLNLPHKLRMRINAVIRKGRGARAFVAGSFVTGIVVSFLELACTGQVYLPTITVVVSQPDLRARAIVLLVLYNLLFILPLVVVFVLAYYGTTSKQLTQFLQERAAVVKLGMAILFAALAAWLIVSVVTDIRADIRSGGSDLSKLPTAPFVMHGQAAHSAGETCCGREDRCDTPPCAGDRASCWRG